MRWDLEQECLQWAGRTFPGGAMSEMNAETGLLQIREIGIEDGRNIPGVPVYLLVHQGSADEYARVGRPAHTREFKYELIEGKQSAKA